MEPSKAQARSKRGPYSTKNNPQEKKSWYHRNREHALEMNRQWRLKKQEEEQQIKRETAVKSKQTIGMSLFEILDVLRKDVKHYLWGKSVINWNETDWHKFNQLK
jgi:hypothetical protein